MSVGQSEESVSSKSENALFFKDLNIHIVPAKLNPALRRDPEGLLPLS